LNLLDLVPTFRRQLHQYVSANDTDSLLAAYLADAIDALNWRWVRTYVVEHTPPHTYEVEPTVTAKDKRPIVLMASIIYKGSNVELARFSDGDFAWDPQQGRTNPLATDIGELEKILPNKPRLFRASTAPLRGFSNGFNPESYHWLSALVIPNLR
jgi:hypothetical protein